MSASPLGPGVTIAAVDSTGSLVPTEPLTSVAVEFPPISVAADEELLMSYYIPVAPLQALVSSVSRDSAARLFETTLRCVALLHRMHRVQQNGALCVAAKCAAVGGHTRYLVERWLCCDRPLEARPRTASPPARH